jgi:hypothetical protein
MEMSVLAENQSAVESQSKNRPALETNNLISSADLRATIMTIMICSLSVLEHISAIGCVMFPYFNYTDFLALDYVCFASNFITGFKHSVNFFLFNPFLVLLFQ